MEHYKTLMSKCEISPEMMKKAQLELHETEERRETVVGELRKLIEENRDKEYSDKKAKEFAQSVAERFVNADTDTLLRFIRARKFDVNRTYKLLEGYAKYRERYPTVMLNLTLDSVKPAILQCHPMLIPIRTKEGHVALLFSVGKWDPEKCPIDDLLRACIFILELLLKNEETQINGLVFIENYSGFTFRQMFAMSSKDMKKLVDMLQGSFPGRFKGIHVINQPWYFNIPFTLMKPFLNKKMESRIFLHGYNLDNFKAEFDVSILPKSFGGTGPDYDPEKLVAALEELVESQI